MILRQTLDHAVHGYWDGGAKSQFDWKIDGGTQHDAKGAYVRIGSWSANHWFHVAVGKTEKRTLANAKLHLKAVSGIPCKFEYID